VTHRSVRRWRFERFTGREPLIARPLLVIAARIVRPALAIGSALQPPQLALRSRASPRVFDRLSGRQHREMLHARVDADHRLRRGRARALR